MPNDNKTLFYKEFPGHSNFAVELDYCESYQTAELEITYRRWCDVIPEGRALLDKRDMRPIFYLSVLLTGWLAQRAIKIWIDPK